MKVLEQGRKVLFDKGRRWRSCPRSAFVLLACMVVLTTASALTMPAITITQGAAKSEAGFYTQGQQDDAGITAGDPEKADATADATATDAAPTSPSTTSADAPAYPEQDLSGTLDLGDDLSLDVRVEAGEGVLPEGTSLELDGVTDAADIDLMKAGAAEKAGIPAESADVIAADISFNAPDGSAVEPRGKVVVSLACPVIEPGSQLAVVHVERAEAPGGRDVADVVGLGDLEGRDTIERSIEGGTVYFEADAFSPYGIVYTPPAAPADEQLTEATEADGQTTGVAPAEAPMPARRFTADVTAADGSTVTVTVDADEGAFAEGVTMGAAPVTDDAVIGAARAEAADKTPMEDGAAMRALAVDITFTDADGEAVEPARPVHVSMATQAIAGKDRLAVVHVDDDRAAQLVPAGGVAADQDSVSFDADAFSVYALVYTVDFHYEVDGKTYQYTLTGGDALSLSQLVQALGIPTVVGDDQPSADNQNAGNALPAEDDSITAGTQPVDGARVTGDAIDEVPSASSDPTSAGADDAARARDFVSHVDTVQFSNPELLSVSKVDADTTVGAVKTALDLHPDYSTELTAEQVAEMDARVLTAPDWALISLRPFDSEETLTVTMENGYQFVVKVTDAKINVSSLDDLNGKEFVLVTNGNAMLTNTNLNDWRIEARIIDTNNANALNNAPKWIFERDANTTNKFYITCNGQCLRISNEQNKGIWVEDTNARQALSVELKNNKIRITDDYGNAVNLFGNDVNQGFGRWKDDNSPYPNEYFSMYTATPSVTFSGTHQNRGAHPEYEGAEDRDVEITVGNNGKATVTLPNDGNFGHPVNYKAPDGTSNGWKLAGWYDVTHNKYYALSGDGNVTAEVEPGTVFYADWQPASYDYGQDKTALGGVLESGTTPGTVPDLTGIVKTEVFDFSSMFNMNNPSSQNVYLDGTDWRVGDNNYAYVFFDDNSTSQGSFDNPAGRGDYNKSRNVWTGDSTVYPGIYNSRIWGQGTVQDTVFGDSELLGKTKVGEGPGLYYLNEDGYYEYDSAKHAASYNQRDGRFYVYQNTQKITESEGTAFLPFNGEAAEYSRQGSYINYWFGIKSTIDFDLADAPGPNSINKDTNGKDLIFSFSGDDDVWVVVDGKLVLDIGGIHSAATGYINFTKGTYSVNGEIEKPLTNRDLSLEQGPHKLEFYYLERGASDSNCKVQFNITRLGNLEFQKTDGKGEKLGGAKFSLYRDPACTELLTRAYKDTDGSVKYTEYHATSSDENGLVRFEKVPVGTYYMKEDEPPEGFEPDGRVYVAKIVVEDAGAGTEAKSHIYWNEHPYDKVKNEKRFPLEIKKAWKINGKTVEWPTDHEVAYKVNRHVYLAIDPGWELDEMPEIESAREDSFSSGILTSTEPTALLEDLPRTGVWTAPAEVPQELLNYGIAPGQKCYVYYRYEVVEDAANSVKPADSPYTYTNQSVFAVDGQVEVQESGQPKTVDGQIGELVNTLSSVTVEKKWSDGNDSHAGDSVTVQLYRYTQKPEDSGEDVGDETIRLSLNTTWQNEDGTAASGEDIPTDGNIIVKVTGNGITKRAVLNANNNWTAQVPGLPKYDSAKQLITYTAVVESVNKGTNIVSVSDLGDPAITFSGEDQSKILTGRVKAKQGLNEDMEVTFDANWIDETNVSATPSNDAEIVATIKSSDGSSQTVTLNSQNKWASTVTLPRVAHGVAVTHTVTYTSSGTNVIANDVSGLTSFSGETTAVHVTGKMRKVVTADKMTVIIDASNLMSTDGSAWAVRPDASGTMHTSDWQKQKSFTPSRLTSSEPIAYANDVDLKDANGNTAVYYFSIAADHANDFVVRSDSSSVVITKNGDKYDIAITATGGEVRLYVENAPASSYMLRFAPMKRLQKAMTLGASADKTFSENEIISSTLQLPKDAEKVGSEVTLEANSSWKHLWPNLPATDENGNKYYYYVKETSATTAAGSRIIAINANYDYSKYGDSAAITVTNTPTYDQPTPVTIKIQKLDAKENTKLSGAVFSLWKYDADKQGYVQINGNVAVDANGQASVENLTVGSYQLREVTAPSGYNKLQDPISFSITFEGAVEFENTDLVTYKSSEFTIKNEPGAALPNTGGPGTHPLMTAGLLLSAGCGLLTWRRHERA